MTQPQTLQCDRTSELPCSVALGHSRTCERFIAGHTGFRVTPARERAEIAMAAATGGTPPQQYAPQQYAPQHGLAAQQQYAQQQQPAPAAQRAGAIPAAMFAGEGAGAPGYVPPMPQAPIAPPPVPVAAYTPPMPQAPLRDPALDLREQRRFDLSWALYRAALQHALSLDYEDSRAAARLAVRNADLLLAALEEPPAAIAAATGPAPLANGVPAPSAQAPSVAG